MVDVLDELIQVALHRGDVRALYEFLKMNPHAEHYPQAATKLDAGTISRVCSALREAFDKSNLDRG